MLSTGKEGTNMKTIKRIARFFGSIIGGLAA
jgi:hypothetical protein